MSLACGGRGPCCHVGYPHRHCEHCDVVIALQTCHHTVWPQPWYGITGNTWQSQLSGGLSALEAQFNQVEYPDK